MNNEQILTIKQAMEYMHIGRTMLWRLTNRADFPVLRLGRKLLIPKDALDEWIVKNRQDQQLR